MIVQANLQDAINLIEDSARELGYSLPLPKKNDKGAVWIYACHLLTLSRIGDMVIFELDPVRQNLDINHRKAYLIYDELGTCLIRRYGECHDAVSSNVLASKTLRKLPQCNSEEEFSTWQAKQGRLADLTPEQLADEFLNWLAEQPTVLAAEVGEQVEQPAKTNDYWWLGQVDDIGNDRQVILLWRKGRTASEIGVRVKRESSTIIKKISELRARYGDKIVPYHRKKVTTQPTALQSAGPRNILIVTVMKVETQAVLKVFLGDNTEKWQSREIGKQIYYDLGIHSDKPIFMVQSEPGSATPGGALLTVHQAIRDLHPLAVIMCGIAFGLRPDQHKLGDILIADQLECYEPQKVDFRRGRMPRGDRVTASERLLNRFRSGANDWQGAPTHFGLVLSGEKLVNDSSFRDRLLKFESEAVGGEMEGAGLYIAARNAKVDWILVKAICDWADGSKNDDAQPKAAKNAAQFVLHVLQLGGWG